MLASYSYDTFGAIRSQTGTSTNQWLFTGEQRDGEPGFYYLRARHYDPATGRFLGQDPLPTGNPYAYVGNNPVNAIDPSGLCPPTVCAPAAAGCVIVPGVGCVVGGAVGVGVTGTVACFAVDCGGAVVEGVGDALDAVGGLFSKKSKPKGGPLPHERNWQLEYDMQHAFDPPTIYQLFPPGWSCWDRLPRWVCLAIGASPVPIGIGRIIDYIDQHERPPILRGEKPPPRFSPSGGSW